MWEHLLKTVSPFVHDIEWFLGELGIRERALALEADHLGLRLADPGAVRALHDELITLGHLSISDAIVNGRMIHIIRLSEPLVVGPWSIPCIELPYPKPGHAYEDGWEHIELVLPTTADSLDGFRNVFRGAFSS